MVAFAYVDGFALYHMCFRGRRNLANAHLKWLDVRSLVEFVLPDEQVEQVTYYTARVSDPPDDPARSTRQDISLQALATVPKLVVRLGVFHRNKREAHLVRPISGHPARQTVWIMQEKRSDVALATDLLLDAFDGRFDTALLLTNDSDFVDPVRIVRERFGRRVVVISPDEMVGKQLAKVASFARPLDRGLLARCQLPDGIVDAAGRAIARPAEWRLNQTAAEGEPP